MLLWIVLLSPLPDTLASESPPQSTYCNPINLDYGYCPIPQFVERGCHRTTADPAIIVFRGDYYLFSTNQGGYWWSSDLLRWNFVAREFLKPEHRALPDGTKIYDDLCAPAPLVIGDALYVIGSTYTKVFPIWKSTNPRAGQWTEAIEAFSVGAWDPAFFLDDDGRLYLYHGSSNDRPIYGVEIDRRTLQPNGPQRELIKLDDEQHGWERFGEANDNTFLRPFIEGAWMTRSAYGDYPHYLPHVPSPAGSVPGGFTGWMLLNYAKPVTASSTLGGFAPNFAVDEDIRTYWSAATDREGEHFTSDLGAVSTVRAIQINYADQDAAHMGKMPGLAHRYILRISRDGESWTDIVDKSDNRQDVPHEYIELCKPVEARYVRIENRQVPSGKFALSGLRVFGHGHGRPPEPVPQLEVLRGDSDRRNAWLKWRRTRDATGYVVYCGIAPDKMYTSVMVYGTSEYYFRAMDRETTYFFTIEAFNESGISARTQPVRVD